VCQYRGVTHEFFGMTPFIAEAERAQTVAGQGLQSVPITDEACGA